MLSVYIDTNAINSKQDNSSINELEVLAEKYPENLIIEKTDALDTELLKNSTYNSKRLEKSDKYIESYGLAVLGHSRLGHTVTATQKEEEMFSEILEIIFSKKNRSEYKEQEIRDAMHVMTAIKYGGNYFMTSDKKVLSSSEKISKRFSSTIICSPEACLKLVKDKLNSWLGINL